MFITLNGFYQGPETNDISWHRHEGEEAGFSADNLKNDESILVFGRVTYDMMVSWWPTPAALAALPEVAKGMNRSEKIVFSKTLKKAEWENTRLIKGDAIAEMEKLKATPGKNMTILGSGSLVTQFSNAGLIDVYQVMIDPVAIIKGKTLFDGLQDDLNLTLTDARTFTSGTILATYKPF
jgi:dihydrofolate reductase